MSAWCLIRCYSVLIQSEFEQSSNTVTADTAASELGWAVGPDWGCRNVLCFSWNWKNISAVCWQRKLLALYLHHDDSIQAHVFCSQLLCSESIVNFLAANFLTWAWDLTHPENMNRWQTGGLLYTCDRAVSFCCFSALAVATNCGIHASTDVSFFEEEEDWKEDMTI